MIQLTQQQFSDHMMGRYREGQRDMLAALIWGIKECPETKQLKMEHYLAVLERLYDRKGFAAMPSIEETVQQLKQEAKT